MTPLLPQALDIILPLNESRARAYVFHVNYVFIENDKYYRLIYLHAVLSGFITLTNIIAVDCMFLVSAQHACGIFQVLGYAEFFLISNKKKKFIPTWSPRLLILVITEIRKNELLTCQLLMK